MAQYDNAEEPQIIIERRGGTSVGPFLIGVAIGAGIALLLAPQSGVDTRQSLKRGAGKAKRRARQLADTATERATETIEDIRTNVGERIDATRRVIDRKTREVSRVVDAGRMAARDAREALERRIAETRAEVDDDAETGRNPVIPPNVGGGSVS